MNSQILKNDAYSAFRTIIYVNSPCTKTAVVCPIATSLLPWLHRICGYDVFGLSCAALVDL